MKKILLLYVAIICVGFLSLQAHACIDSNCNTCPEGFSIVTRCCNSSDQGDCIILTDEIEDCGLGQWAEHPKSFSVPSKRCCKDSSENYCRLIHHEDYCGVGEFKDYPYSPIKKCCKDDDENDCVTISLKKKCGKYQLDNYSFTKSDCCNADFTECTGYVRDCPKCL